MRTSQFYNAVGRLDNYRLERRDGIPIGAGIFITRGGSRDVRLPCVIFGVDDALYCERYAAICRERRLSPKVSVGGYFMCFDECLTLNINMISIAAPTEILRLMGDL